MQSSTTVTNRNSAWPDPLALTWRLGVAFALAISLAWLGGRDLVSIILPTTHALLDWFDNRFSILFLGLDHTGQDTVIRLRVNVIRYIVLGNQVVEPQPKGWLEVTTTVGAMLQPLIIATGMAGAWPGGLVTRLSRILVAALAGIGFMVIDIPLTLHAFVWDMFVQRLDPLGFSALMTIHQLLHGGARLGVGVLLGGLSIRAVTRWRSR